jgi:hypothetical protein
LINRISFNGKLTRTNNIKHQQQERKNNTADWAIHSSYTSVAQSLADKYLILEKKTKLTDFTVDNFKFPYHQRNFDFILKACCANRHH